VDRDGHFVNGTSVMANLRKSRPSPAHHKIVGVFPDEDMLEARAFWTAPAGHAILPAWL
jgi:hypothetical protein